MSDSPGSLWNPLSWIRSYKMAKEDVVDDQSASNMEVNEINEIACTESLITNLSVDSSSSSEMESTEESSEDSISDDESYHSNAENRIQYSKFPISGTKVFITSVIRSNLLYIRSMTENIEHFQVIHMIHHQGKKAQKIVELPQPGDIIITQFKDYAFYRALVLKIYNAKRINVVYIDFGNVDEKSLDELYSANDIVKNMTCHIFPIFLKDVNDFFVNNTIKTEIESWILKTELKCIYEGKMTKNGPYVCDIFDWQKSQSLREKINSMHNCIGPLECVQYYIEPERIAIEGNNISLIILDNKTIQTTKMITCIRQKDIMALQQFNKEIGHYVKQIKDKECYTPRVGELCLVQTNNDGRWYRGCCQQVLGDGYPTISFVDFGNFAPIHINKIRQYPQYFNFPIFSCDLEVFGLPNKINDKLAKRLMELLPVYKGIIANEVFPIPEVHLNIAKFDKVIQTIKAEDLLC